MASPDTIILLIVDNHAAIGGQDPRAPTPISLHTPLRDYAMLTCGSMSTPTTGC